MRSKDKITPRGEDEPDPQSSCLRKALDLLARRAHFQAELRGKLTARGFAAEVVELALERLRERGLLDEAQTARAFVEERRSRGWARPRLDAELRRRGVSGDIIAAVLGEFSDEDDAELAVQAAERWRRRGGDSRPALARHLARKGFSSHAILLVFERFAADEESDGAGRAASDRLEVS